MEEPQLSRSGLGSALGAYLIWGLAPLYWKTVGSIPSAQITTMRCVHSLVLLIAFLWFVRGQSPRSLFNDRRATITHLIAGLLLGSNWMVFVYAVSTDRVVDASLGYFINPLMSVALGAVLFGERLTSRRWVAIGIALLGVIILTYEAGSLPWIALFLSTTFAVYGAVKKQSPKGPIEGLGMEMIWIAPLAIAYLVWLIVAGDFTFGVGAAPAMSWFLGILTATPLLLFGAAAKKIPLWAVGLLQYVAPTLQFLIGVLVFGEEANAMRLLGFSVIWVGLVVFALDSVRTARASAKPIS